MDLARSTTKVGDEVDGHLFHEHDRVRIRSGESPYAYIRLRRSRANRVAMVEKVAYSDLSRETAGGRPDADEDDGSMPMTEQATGWTKGTPAAASLLCAPLPPLVG